MKQAGLGSRWAPLALGTATSLLTWYVWGSLRQVPFLADEAAYVLQSNIFAHGHWAAPPPPFPEFFEQAYVLLRPVIAAKYPPGHALLLAAGTLLGLPGLVPVLLSGIAGGLVFALARRVAGAWVGLFTWLIWASTFDVLRYDASYMSEITTGTLWLVGWWALLRWRDDGRVRWLSLVTAAVAWSAITRPLTGIAYAVPILVVVLRDIARRGAWRDLAPPTLAGVAILALVPLWSARTTGDWRVTPLMAYTRAYMPTDHPGFGLQSDQAAIALPPDQAEVEYAYRLARSRHTVSALPMTLARRLFELARHFAGSGWRLALLPFLVVGFGGLPPAGRFAVAGAATLLGAYLSYAHPAFWTVYYYEIEAVLAFVAAWGLWRVLGQIRVTATPPLALMASVLLGVGLAWSGNGVRVWLEQLRSAEVRLLAAVGALPGERKIVFVRYSLYHYAHLSFVRNQPFLSEAPTWFVYDRGPENARLMAAAPDRVPYLADEGADYQNSVRGER